MSGVVLSLARWSSATLSPLAPLALVAVLTAPTTAAGAPGTAPLTPPGAGGRVVTFDGVAVRVPADWPVYDLSREPDRCVRLDVHAVYLGTPGSNELCPAHLVGRTEAVMIAPSTAGANASDAEASGAHTRLLGHGRLRVTATYGGNESLARTIEGSAVATSTPGTTTSPSIAPAAFARPALTPATATSTPGTFIGNGFDACDAPSTSAMQAWIKSSPYRAANIYIGGAMRACANSNLTASWVTAVRSMGWRLIPTYVGLQAPCTSFSRTFASDPTTAAAQGSQAADDADALSRALGLDAGSPLYFDMENYSRSASGCSAAVLSFLSGWTQELHAKGWTSGAYGSGGSLVSDLSAQWGTSYPEPDDLWLADWNNLDSVYGDPYVPDSEWTGHRRIHQWHGGQTESYGGYSINIDGDAVDGQVAGPPGGDCISYGAETYGPDGCDGALSLSGPLQYWRLGSPDGLLQSARWTYGNGSTETNGATWAPSLSAGVYDLTVWVPTVHSGANVHYTVNDTGGSHSLTVDQSAHPGSWVSLGQYSTGLNGTITLHAGDDTSTSTVVGVDAAKFHYVHAIDVNPPSGTITSPASRAFARPGAPVTLAGSFTDDAYVTKVVFWVADSGGSWQQVGTDTHNGNGTFKVSWPESFPGGSVVSVRADVYDTASHVTTVTASNVLTIDATRPSAALTQPAAAYTLGSSTTLGWTGADTGSGVSSWDLRGQWSTSSGWVGQWHRVGPANGFTATGARFGGMRPGWQYCFEVRAHDRAGNLSAWTPPRCVSRALDDRWLASATTGWWRPSGKSAYLQSTFASTTRYNAKLTRSGVSAGRIALLATRCPQCGKVRLYLADRYVGTVNLYAPSWRTHQFVAVRTFARVKGTLTVRVITGGKLVRIDAIAVGRQ